MARFFDFGRSGREKCRHPDSNAVKAGVKGHAELAGRQREMRAGNERGLSSMSSATATVCNGGTYLIRVGSIIGRLAFLFLDVDLAQCVFDSCTPIVHIAEHFP